MSCPISKAGAAGPCRVVCTVAVVAPKRLTSAGPPANSFQFTAHEYDPEIGNHYYRARYYDPQIGRFFSEDFRQMDEPFLSG